MREIIYFIIGNEIKSYYLHDGLLFPSNSELKKIEDFDRYQRFSKLSEARYALFLKNVLAGKSFEKYRSSKYFPMYVERLREEYPEFAI